MCIVSCLLLLLVHASLYGISKSTRCFAGKCHDKLIDHENSSYKPEMVTRARTYIVFCIINFLVSNMQWLCSLAGHEHIGNLDSSPIPISDSYIPFV